MVELSIRNLRLTRSNRLGARLFVTSNQAHLSSAFKQQHPRSQIVMLMTTALTVSQVLHTLNDLIPQPKQLATLTGRKRVYSTDLSFATKHFVVRCGKKSTGLVVEKGQVFIRRVSSSLSWKGYYMPMVEDDLVIDLEF